MSCLPEVEEDYFRKGYENCGALATIGSIASMKRTLGEAVPDFLAQCKNGADLALMTQEAKGLYDHGFL